CRRIEPLLMQIKFGAACMNLAQESDEILQRSPEPIDGPGHDDVEPAAGRIPTQAGESGGLVAALWTARGVIRVDLHDLVTEALGYSPKFPLLVVRGLVERGRA